MSVRHAIFRMLDRPGGRELIGYISSAYLQMATRKRIEIAYDGEFWRHRVNGWQFFLDKPSFRHYGNAAASWAESPGAEICNAEIWWYKVYRPQPGDVILDIGAGRGEDVIAFSRSVGEQGRVIAVEANPRTFRILQKFCAANRLRNVVPIHAAVADRPGKLNVVESGGGEWQTDIVSADQAGIEVDSTTLDRICEEQAIDEVAFLKMNIEGAERLALPGLRNSVSRIRTICVCCHDFRADAGEDDAFRTRSFVEDYLRRHGFEIRNVAYRADFERDHVHAVRRPAA